MSANCVDLSAADIIRTLDMRPHPEGGHYVETFRDVHAIDGRAACTAIFFLLQAGETSHWHRVDATEIWLWHAGAPLALSISDGVAKNTRTARIGADLGAGERPQAVVPKGAWQSAQSLGAWTLVSCVVAPGFQFSGFALAPRDWRPA